jgi:hypothetical protein
MAAINLKNSNKLGSRGFNKTRARARGVTTTSLAP